MHGQKPIDPGREIDWGKTSVDYAQYRSGPPLSFYQRLLALDVGLPQQKILDLGTGTGVLARQFARQGCQAFGVDISAQQIEQAKQMAQSEGLHVEFKVAPAEEIPFKEKSFDIITAHQCWLYFDPARAIKEVKRLLKPGGLLVTGHLCWLPRLDKIAKASEELVLKFNPQWTAHNWSGEVPPMPEWAKRDFNLRAMFYYDEPIPFTHDSWRGRFRACRGVGASLSPDEVKAFDQAHSEVLKSIAKSEFTVLHRIDAHIFQPKE